MREEKYSATKGPMPPAEHETIEAHLNALDEFVSEFGRTKACFRGAECLVCTRDIQATLRAGQAIAFLRDALGKEEER